MAATHQAHSDPDGTTRAAPAPRLAVPSAGSILGAILARYGAWLDRLDQADRMREIEPRLARDAGIPAGADRCPDGWVVDPRPLWGIGQTPGTGDVLPDWNSRR